MLPALYESLLDELVIWVARSGFEFISASCTVVLTSWGLELIVLLCWLAGVLTS